VVSSVSWNLRYNGSNTNTCARKHNTNRRDNETAQAHSYMAGAQVGKSPYHISHQSPTHLACASMLTTTMSRVGALLLLFPSVTSGNLFDGNLRGRNKRWYVDYSLGTQGQCVKSCAPSRGSFCGGVKEFWEEAYPTADECCEKKLWWMPKTQCKRRDVD
jgi:hypothetical protein